MKENILQGNKGWNAERGQRFVRQNEGIQGRRDTVRRIFREVSQNKKRGLE